MSQPRVSDRSMGVILDSSCIIRAERMRQTPVDLLQAVFQIAAGQQVAMSAIGYTELVHGTYRGTSNAHRTLGRAYLITLLASLPVYSYTVGIAEIAGRIDGEQRRIGLRIPFADLLIGATALSLDFAVLTTNLRHFRLIPGLTVLSL